MPHEQQHANATADLQARQQLQPVMVPGHVMATQQQHRVAAAAVVELQDQPHHQTGHQPVAGAPVQQPQANAPGGSSSGCSSITPSTGHAAPAAAGCNPGTTLVAQQHQQQAGSTAQHSMSKPQPFAAAQTSWPPAGLWGRSADFLGENPLLLGPRGVLCRDV
jgi:hypothetical protein